MIKNVVFDFGQVMIHFKPEYIVKQYVTEQNDVELLTKIVFDKASWTRLDEGKLTDEEFLRTCKTQLPKRLWEVSEKIYYNWIYNLPPIEGMADLVKELKNKYKKRVFLLSNISLYFSSHHEQFEVLKLFEKCIFSAECGMIKPNKAIFEFLCDKCNILPEETLFIDDSPNNIDGAKEIGINGYLFDGDAQRLKNYLDNLFTKE